MVIGRSAAPKYLKRQLLSNLNNGRIVFTKGQASQPPNA